MVSGREMRALFPDATVLRERVAGITKSFVAVAGFPSDGASAFTGLRRALRGLGERPAGAAMDRAGPSHGAPARGYGEGRRAGGAG
jgi:hypothetical protein